VIWIQAILYELGVPQPYPACLWCDNLGATYLTANPMFYAYTKHIEVDFHFVLEKLVNKLLEVRFVCTQDQIADAFMKPLTVQKLTYFQNYLNLG
jgi:hypothetical protein